MNKNKVFVISLFLIFIANIFVVNGLTVYDDITGKVSKDVTGKFSEDLLGKASSQTMNMSIFVIPVVPFLELYSPENETYLYNDSIKLDYFVALEDKVWYNFDDGENITIYQPFTFDEIEDGEHTINLYANNTYGTSQRTAIFSVNVSKIIIIFDEFKNESTRGDSTNFSRQTYEDLQNLSGIILENTLFGRIDFEETINVTDDDDPTDNIIDIDSNVKITQNSIEVKSHILENFNKPANLSIYNISFNNPQVLRNGIICPEIICDRILMHYRDHYLKFDVTQFTIYSARETPNETETIIIGGGSSGGSGGGSIIYEETECVEDWACTDWDECIIKTDELYGLQTRRCVDRSNCDTNVSKPSFTQSCVIPQAPSKTIQERIVRFSTDGVQELSGQPIILALILIIIIILSVESYAHYKRIKKIRIGKRFNYH